MSEVANNGRLPWRIVLMGALDATKTTAMGALMVSVDREAASESFALDEEALDLIEVCDLGGRAPEPGAPRS